MLLGILRRPATAEELNGLIAEGHSVRGLRDRLLSDERFIRTDRSRVGLRGWGVEEYSGIVEEIEEEICDAVARQTSTILCKLLLSGSVCAVALSSATRPCRDSYWTAIVSMYDNQMSRLRRLERCSMKRARFCLTRVAVLTEFESMTRYCGEAGGLCHKEWEHGSVCSLVCDASSASETTTFCLSHGQTVRSSVRPRFPASAGTCTISPSG